VYTVQELRRYTTDLDSTICRNDTLTFHMTVRVDCGVPVYVHVVTALSESACIRLSSV
jgi:hypothetical protein